MGRGRLRSSLLNAAVRCLHRLMCPLPFRVTRVISGWLGTLAYYLVVSEREKALRHLALALGDEYPSAERKRIARRTFRNYGYSAAEFVQFAKGLVET